MLLERSKRWTKDEYQKLTTIFPEGVRVELVEGVLVEMSPQNPQHSYCVAKLSKALTRGLPENYTVRVQLPLDLTNSSQPEPDIAVVKADSKHFSAHPTNALLVVEVADTSLEYDRETKKALYQTAGIPEYWIVDVGSRTVEVYDGSTVTVLTEADTLYSSRLPFSIKVEELFT